HFGIFAIYAALVLVLGSISTLKYEQAINLPEKDEEAKSILYLSLSIALLISAVLLIIAMLFSREIALLLGNPEIQPWLYVLPASTLLAGTANALSFWFNRVKGFQTIAVVRTGQSGVNGAAQLAFGF